MINYTIGKLLFKESNKIKVEYLKGIFQSKLEKRIAF